MDKPGMGLRVVVLGAGVVGLSTALQLQTAFPEARVKIVARDFFDQTTSFGAAGIFRPTLGKIGGFPVDKIRMILRDSWQHYDQLLHSEEAAEAGVQAISGYQFVESPEPNFLEKDFVYHYRPLTPKEMTAFPGVEYKHGWFVTTLLVEPGRYLPFLLRQFRRKNGLIVKKEVVSLQQFAGKCDLLVNCLGLGNVQITNDRLLYPVRGQLVKVRAPWLKHFVFAGLKGECYIYPGVDVVSVGGTQQAGDFNTDVDPSDSEAIMKRACALVPSLKKAEVLYEWAGLRPVREPIRIESEVLSFPSGQLKVVHNYGHGGEGVGLSWGSGRMATTLAQKLLGTLASL